MKHDATILQMLVMRLRTVLPIENFEMIEDLVGLKIILKNIGPLFYISDQMANFLRVSELELPPSSKLVIEHQMANSSIIISLLSMYIREKGLRNGNNMKFFPDDRMKRFFSSTYPVLDGKRKTENDIRKDPKTELIVKTLLSEGDKSIFEILKNRKSRKTNEPFYIKQTGSL